MFLSGFDMAESFSSISDNALPAGAMQALVSAAGAKAAPNDLGRAGRWGLWALGLGFGGFLLWAALAPLDEGVPRAKRYARGSC